MTSKALTRENLKNAYLIAFDNFATDTSEVGRALNLSGTDTNLLFREMENVLIASTHVNGEKKLTWQALETYDSISRRQAIARFNKAFPKDWKPAKATTTVKTARKGATGPRYSKAQLKKAVQMRKAGESWKAIGLALDIRATAYLAKLLKPELAAKPKRVVRRSTKAGA